MRADRIVVLDKGRSRRWAHTIELLENNGIYACLYIEQFKSQAEIFMMTSSAPCSTDPRGSAKAASGGRGGAVCQPRSSAPAPRVHLLWGAVSYSSFRGLGLVETVVEGVLQLALLLQMHHMHSIECSCCAFLRARS